MKHPHKEIDWEEVYYRKAEVASSTIQWLSRHAYIIGERLNSEIFTDVCLTEPGLPLAGLKPKSLMPTE